MTPGAKAWSAGRPRHVIDKQKSRKTVTAIVLATALFPPAAWSVEQDTAARAEELWKEGARLYLDERYETAIDRYEQSLALQPTARTLTYLARSLYELDRREEAVEHVRRAIDLDPEYANAYGVLGTYLIELERPGEAIPPLRKASEMPGYCCPHFAHYQLGRAYLMQGKIDKAKTELRASISVNPRFRPPLRLLERIRSGSFKSL